MNKGERLNGLDLFSGIGGNTLGLRDYIKTIAYCERDRHAQSVLLSRMSDNSIERAPIWEDIATLKESQFDLPIDIIVGGFPCQDISTAGKGAGIENGERSGLFFQVSRLVKELGPIFVFLENVPAIRTRGLDIVLKELTEAGYDCRWTMLSASSLGALHKRERWFLLATHRECIKLWQQQGRSSREKREGRSFPRHDGEKESMAHSHSMWELPEQGQHDRLSDRGKALANSDSKGFKESLSSGPEEKHSQSLHDIVGYDWKIEPDVGRVANGVPLRVDRITRLGNAVVPGQAKVAFKLLMGII